ncbi:hypothetical protein SNK03_001140 [Fusarium graminearum]|nr:unnamed protein product [Fusarium graminearum]
MRGEALILLDAKLTKSPLPHNAGSIFVSGSGSDPERPILTGDQPHNASFIYSPTAHNNSNGCDALLIKLIQRDEEEGSGCSTEGQWHCMTNSFQRCAQGHWSMKMNMAEGTKCVPAGYTDDYNFRIEHEGKDDDNGGNRSDENRSNSGASLEAWTSNIAIAVMAISSLWAALGVIV